MPDSQGFPWDLIGEYVSKTPQAKCHTHCYCYYNESLPYNDRFLKSLITSYQQTFETRDAEELHFIHHHAWPRAELSASRLVPRHRGKEDASFRTCDKHMFIAHFRQGCEEKVDGSQSMVPRPEVLSPGNM